MSSSSPNALEQQLRNHCPPLEIFLTVGGEVGTDLIAETSSIMNEAISTSCDIETPQSMNNSVAITMVPFVSPHPQCPTDERRIASRIAGVDEELQSPRASAKRFTFDEYTCITADEPSEVEMREKGAERDPVMERREPTSSAAEEGSATSKQLHDVPNDEASTGPFVSNTWRFGSFVIKLQSPRTSSTTPAPVPEPTAIAATFTEHGSELIPTPTPPSLPETVISPTSETEQVQVSLVAEAKSDTPPATGHELATATPADVPPETDPTPTPKSNNESESEPGMVAEIIPADEPAPAPADESSSIPSLSWYCCIIESWTDHVRQLECMLPRSTDSLETDDDMMTERTPTDEDDIVYAYGPNNTRLELEMDVVDHRSSMMMIGALPTVPEEGESLLSEHDSDFVSSPKSIVSHGDGLQSVVLSQDDDTADYAPPLPPNLLVPSMSLGEEWDNEKNTQEHETAMSREVEEARDVREIELPHQNIEIDEEGSRNASVRDSVAQSHVEEESESVGSSNILNDTKDDISQANASDNEVTGNKPDMPHEARQMNQVEEDFQDVAQDDSGTAITGCIKSHRSEENLDEPSPPSKEIPDEPKECSPMASSVTQSGSLSGPHHRANEMWPSRPYCRDEFDLESAPSDELENRTVTRLAT